MNADKGGFEIISCKLPVLFANGKLSSLKAMNIDHLRSFIQFMSMCSEKGEATAWKKTTEIELVIKPEENQEVRNPN
jgi:hypothetical protein